MPVAPGISAGAEGGIGWWSDAQADLLRKACDKSGKYCYTPLYTMKRRIRFRDKAMRLFRDKQVEPSGDDLCVKRAWAFFLVGLMGDRDSGRVGGTTMHRRGNRSTRTVKKMCLNW